MGPRQYRKLHIVSFLAQLRGQQLAERSRALVLGTMPIIAVAAGMATVAIPALVLAVMPPSRGNGSLASGQERVKLFHSKNISMRKIHIEPITNPMHWAYIGIGVGLLGVVVFVSTALPEYHTVYDSDIFQLVGENSIMIGACGFLIGGLLSLAALHKNRETGVDEILNLCEGSDALVFSAIVAFLLSGYEGDVAGFVKEYIFTVSLTALLWISYIFNVITLEMSTLR